MTVKLTIGGCPLRADIKREIEQRVGIHPGVTDVRIEWGEMTPDERTETMLKARWNARAQVGDTQVPATTRILADRQRQGRRRQELGHRQPRRRARPPGPHGRRARRRHLGLLRAPPARHHRADGGAARRRAATSPLIVPNELPVGAGLLKVVSTGFLVDEDTALMWRGLMLTKAVEQFLRDVAWGELDDLLIDMPPGTGDVQMGLARLLPRADMIIVTTPALAAQKVAQRAADMARRSFVRVVGVVENMTDFTCAHGEHYPLFGAGGGAALAAEIGVPLLGQVPLEPAVSAGGDAGRPVALGDDGPRRHAFRSIVARLDEVVAPTPAGSDVDLSACSAHQPARSRSCCELADTAVLASE